MKLSKHKIRCDQIPGYAKAFDKLLNEEIKKGPVNVEALAEQLLKKMCIPDPCLRMKFFDMN